MLLQERRRSPRLFSFILDIVHIVISCLIALLAVLAFWDPDDNRFLFPVIFLLGAVLYAVSGICQFKSCGRVRKKRMEAAAVTAVGVFLLLLAAVSAVTIWRG